MSSLILQVKEKLEHRILSGSIAPGDRVNENAVASELNVSRGVVREAIRALEQAGLIRLEENRGAFVRTLSFADVLGLYDIRAGLSRTAGRLAAVNATSEQVLALVALHEQMVEVCGTGDSERYHPLNVEWHDRLFESTRNARLKELHDGISKEVSLFVRHGVLGPASLRVSTREHSEILDAIRGGDADLAAAAFERHVLAGKQRMIDNVARAGAQSGPVAPRASGVDNITPR
jgi:DNA-binding GntR family transcriptional regulator